MGKRIWYEDDRPRDLSKYAGWSKEKIQAEIFRLEEEHRRATLGGRMSRGFGAHANKVAEDDKVVIYEYGGYNLNDPMYRNLEQKYDGTITIQKSCFVEPEVHEKMKKLPSGRKKLVIKRIPVDVDYSEMIKDGRIVIENCSNCWMTSEDELNVDMMACRILFYIFRRYQEEGQIPEMISYNV